jgi:hypothetical protein
VRPLPQQIPALIEQIRSIAMLDSPATNPWFHLPFID